MHIRQVDLNLIAVFDAVMVEGSLSAAGRRLGITQSAVSHALARLRLLTGDELFVRTSRGMRPTAHALVIAGPIGSAVDLVQRAFAKRTTEGPLFEADRTFVVDLPVGFDLVLVPPLLALAEEDGLSPRLRVHADRASDLLTDMRFGDTELALDLAPQWPPGFRCAPLYQDRFVVCARPGHPAAAPQLDEATYLAAGHVTLLWTRASTGSPVDDRLAHLGTARRVTVAMPTLSGCAAVVGSTDLLFTIHSRIAVILANRFGLEVHPMPVPVAPVTLNMIWHDRFEADVGHIWLRRALARVASRL